MITDNTVRIAGHVRIIGGFLRGRKLPVLNSSGLRPTANRARETLFNWLAPVIQEAHCLDCFSGSGALGLEALSRGAASVTLLEQDRVVSTLISRNLETLKTEKARVITTDSIRWLAKSGDVFNIVFIDPPFWKGIVTNTVVMLEQYRHLTKNAWIYIETESKNFFFRTPPHWQIYRKKVTKKVAYFLYLRIDPLLAL